MIDSEAVIAQTQEWFQKVVLGLNLCPFAHQPAKAGRIKFCVFTAHQDRNLLEQLEVEVAELKRLEATQLETTLLILPEGYEDFFFYLSTLEQVAKWQVQKGWEGFMQVASFHPKYQFAHTAANDRENLTNQSPYPLLHLIRESSLSELIDNGADTLSVPDRNIARINSLSLEQLKKLFPYSTCVESIPK
jgi:hypothetical protein